MILHATPSKGSEEIDTISYAIFLSLSFMNTLFSVPEAKARRALAREANYYGLSALEEWVEELFLEEERQLFHQVMQKKGLLLIIGGIHNCWFWNARTDRRR